MTFQKILLFTDTHITAAGADIIGLSPQERLKQGLEHALATHGDAKAIFFMGDLTHHGEEKEYQELRDILADVPLPVHLTLGNHDQRTPFAKVFGRTGFQHSVSKFGNTTVILLDTLDEMAPDKHSGLLCEDRLEWLRDALANADGPAIILMHHHLAPTGFDGMDAIDLRNQDEVLDILTSAGNVRHIINGHIHRSIFTSARGMPVSMIKSTCHQMPLQLGPGSSALSVNEPGAFGVLLLSGKQCILHTEDFGLTSAEVVEETGSFTP